MEPRRPHVLVVEDDAELQAALEEFFESEGYAVDHAENGAEAIEILEHHEPPSAVLVDLLMPGIVGHELLEYLRHDEDLAKLPVAIVSASPQLAPEGYPVFRKPLDLGSLIDFVRAHTPAG